jgi:hypothetical protein
MKLIEKIKNLPDELIHMIINYTDVVVYRHGKYLNRIKKNDYMYNLLRRIPRPIYIGQYRVKIRLMSCNLFGYIIEYNTQKSLTEMNVRFFNREIYGFGIKYNKTYIFDVNNKWSKTTYYSM